MDTFAIVVAVLVVFSFVAIGAFGKRCPTSGTGPGNEPQARPRPRGFGPY